MEDSKKLHRFSLMTSLKHFRSCLVSQKTKHEYYLKDFRAVIIHSISEPIIIHFPPILLLWGKKHCCSLYLRSHPVIRVGLVLPAGESPDPGFSLWSPVSGGRGLTRPACVRLWWLHVTQGHRDTHTCHHAHKTKFIPKSHQVQNCRKCMRHKS